ncbi:MAG: hypothetical protein NZ846_01340 [Thermus sp.]|uniref:hypothetical protein n=1 Tax=Thermus sp. TaxID=275 RepID=UPI0025EC51D6|nr:hypothetical protein [Thermus sp.]MCS7217615.1 hypothetical protein [Thermus sp.]MDW8357993.1 hypothetical protein [Thermus sp.]
MALVRLLPLFLLGLAACAPRVLPPEARLQGAELQGLATQPSPALLLGLRVAFQNPNPFPLPLATLGTRLRVGEVTVPLELTLPPGSTEAVLPVRLTPQGALATAQALLSREGVEVALEGRTLGQDLTFFRTRLAFPLEPPRVRRAGVNLFLENPNPYPLRAEGRLVLLGQSLAVRLELPARGEGRLQVVGFRPGLEGGGGRLELDLEVPGFFRQRLVLPL